MDLELQQFDFSEYNVLPFFYVRFVERNIQIFFRVEPIFALFYAILHVYYFVFNYLVFQKNLRLYVVLYTYIFCSILDHLDESCDILNTHATTTITLLPCYLLPRMMDIIAIKETSWTWLIICGHIVFGINYMTFGIPLNYYIIIISSISTGCLALIVYESWRVLTRRFDNAALNIVNPGN